MVLNAQALSLRQTLIATLKKQRGEFFDPRMEAAFLKVPRHVFLPNEPLERVYSDEAIPIKRDSDGTIISSSSQPSMMATMLRQLRLRPGDNVLEIGTGTGYNAAIMQVMVGDSGNVTTIELENELANEARNHLQRAGMGQVTVVTGDGVMGFAPRASYDRIIATAGILDIPAAWVRQLKPDGLLVVPVGSQGMQFSAAFTIQPDGTLYSGNNIPCNFVPLRGVAGVATRGVRISTSGLMLLLDESHRLDSTAVHLLLSEDAEICHLGVGLTASEYWHGFLPWLLLNIPDEYVFVGFMIAENQQPYGMEGNGFALIQQGSACFVPIKGSGRTHCFAGADAFMTMQDLITQWDTTGRPGSDLMRMRLTPKNMAVSPVPGGRVYPGTDYDLHIWLADS